MAVQVRRTGHRPDADSLRAPRLYVIDFEPVDHATVGDRQHAIRHRRHVRRLRQAASAAFWVAGAAAMLAFLMVGMAGLR